MDATTKDAGAIPGAMELVLWPTAEGRVPGPLLDTLGMLWRETGHAPHVLVTFPSPEGECTYSGLVGPKRAFVWCRRCHDLQEVSVELARVHPGWDMLVSAQRVSIAATLSFNIRWGEA
jgi:hypothetical protein